jgi:hypothetical protein
MMIPQIAEKLTAADIQESFATKSSFSEEWVRGSGFPKTTSKLNYTSDIAHDGQAFITSVNRIKQNDPRPESQELYIQIRDGVVDQIIQHGLSRAESKLFFYFLKLDRFGDRPVKVKVAEVLLGVGIGKTAYHAAITKFEAMGWFSFTHAEVKISNFCTPTKKFVKANSDSANANSDSANANLDSANANSEKLEPSPSKPSKISQTIQTYSNLLQTLSEEIRESFRKFCLKKIQECSFKIGSHIAWLNKHGAEYLQEFQELYSDAIANQESIIPKAEFATPDICSLKRMYGANWEAPAIYYGLISPNSSTVENEEPDLSW